MPHDPEASMTLADLARHGIEGRVLDSRGQALSGVQHDSRLVTQGDLFVAVPGEVHDGADFIDDALSRGAVAVICERPIAKDVPQLIVSDARAALSRAAEAVYGNPTRTLRTVAITGTNGKTTTAYLLAKAIDAASGTAAMIGTTGLSIGDTEVESAHTTPEGDDISRFARRAVDAGATHLVLEASSHGLALRRLDALDVAVAAFTNLSRDHLDFHETLEAYGEAKARLFLELDPGVSVICVDDVFGSKLAERVSGDRVRCSRRPDSGAEVVAKAWSITRDGIDARVQTPAGTLRLQSPMLGEHNLENLLVALGCAYVLGLDLARVVDGWRSAPGSPGRLERVAHPRDVAVLVDYAHTPDALRRVLEALRKMTPGRLCVVFGAGGDRDRGKRVPMGRAAAEVSDICVVTSDNPRTERPDDIASEVERGVAEAGMPRIPPGELPRAARGYCTIVERREAIQAALGSVQDGDTVLIAGKGHETYQIVGTERRHFDDRDEARAAITAFEGEA